MSTTAQRPALTVKAARALLSDTRRADPDVVAQAEMLIRDLQSRRPDSAPGGGLMVARCRACGNATWSLHSDGDDERWACSSCHREPMSDEQGLAFRRAKAERDAASAAEAKRVAETAPAPRAVLTATHAALTEAKVRARRLEAAAPAAIDQLAAARATLGAAEEALATARARIADDMVEALLDPAIAAKKPKTIMAEQAAVDTARAALESASATADTIASKLLDIRDRIQRLERRLPWEAKDVIAAEILDRGALAALLVDPDA